MAYRDAFADELPVGSATETDALQTAPACSPLVELLPDLMHLHFVRMAGVSLDDEKMCTRLARAIAASRVGRARAMS